MKSITLLISLMLLSASSLAFSDEPGVKVVGKCLRVSTAGGQMQLIPITSVISVKVSPFYEDNVGAADEEVKGYIEIVTTALVVEVAKTGAVAVNDKIRMNGINFAEAKKFGAMIEHALGFSENNDNG